MVKGKRPNKRQSEILEANGLKAYLFVVLFDWERSMIVQSVVNRNDVKLLQKGTLV